MSKEKLVLVELKNSVRIGGIMYHPNSQGTKIPESYAKAIGAKVISENEPDKNEVIDSDNEAVVNETITSDTKEKENLDSKETSEKEMSEYSIKETKEGSKWFDVFDSSGNKLNDKSLRKKDAETFIEEL